MGARYGHAAVGVGWLVGRLYRIVRRHHRAQAGGTVLVPEGDGAQGSAATCGHWQLAMEPRHGRDRMVGRALSYRRTGARLARCPWQQPSTPVPAGTLGTNPPLRRRGASFGYAVLARRRDVQ